MSIPPPAVVAVIFTASAVPKPPAIVTPPTSDKISILATPVPWSARNLIVSEVPPLACR